jgi:hypothetical protein
MTTDQNPSTQPAGVRLEYFLAIGIIGLLALILGVACLVMPGTTAQARKTAYTQSGEFTYRAPTPPGSVYGPSGLRAGQPIVTDVVGPVRAGFSYRFDAKAPASDLSGSARLEVDVKLTSGFTRTFPVAPAERFTGDRVVLTGGLPLEKIVRFIKSGAASAATAATATVSLEPRVTLTGVLAGRAFTTSYKPDLSFLFEGTTLTITKDDPTVQATPRQLLRPSDAGAVGYPTRTTNTISLLVAHPPVRPTMWVSLAIAAVALLLVLWLGRPLMHGGPASEPIRIRTLYGSLLVDVRELSLSGASFADVASIDSLANLAKRHQSMIMHTTDARGEVYLLWDNGLAYRYRVPRSELLSRRTDDEASDEGSAHLDGPPAPGVLPMPPYSSSGFAPVSVNGAVRK